MIRYGDPEALDALAAELVQRARAVRDAGEEHRRDGERARWVSDAAAAYRRRQARDCAEVDAAAEAIERAAELLRRHADEVRARLAAIARAERAVRSWLAERAARGENVLEQVGAVLGELPEAGADAWRTVPARLSGAGLW
ncbi:putative T7SS-secreted protein [Blastococcus sp. SYSU DS1024]